MWPDRLPWFDWIVKRSLQACEDADAVVSGIMSVWANSLAEKLKVPWFIGLLQPCTPTRAYPALPFMPYVPSTLGGLNRLTHRITERLFYETVLRMENRSRVEVLGLPAAMNTQPLAGFYKRRAAVLYAYSPTLSPKPCDWPEWHHVTGYWFLEGASNWTPPAGLVEFLSKGAPPVCVGFGSMRDRNPERLTSIVVEALGRTGQRGILLSGWGGLTNSHLPDTIFPIESVPHDWLYPRVAAVVHHGGAGTVGAVLRAGVPSVAVPWRRDHPFFAACAYRLGSSARPIPKKQLSAARLAAAIEVAVHDPQIRARASAIASQVVNENGVGRAVKIIEETVRSRLCHR
jgi:UDP:flavonoid glycosyltransferase YjiC (YdhE family)